MVTRKRLVASCACYDHVIALDFQEDEFALDISFYLLAWDAKQGSFLSRWWERVKMAVTILRGREYLFEDIVLEKDEVQKMREFLNSLVQLDTTASERHLFVAQKPDAEGLIPVSAVFAGRLVKDLDRLED